MAAAMTWAISVASAVVIVGAVAAIVRWRDVPVAAGSGGVVLVAAALSSMAWAWPPGWHLWLAPTLLVAGAALVVLGEAARRRRARGDHARP